MRFYRLRLPAALRVEEPGFMLALLAGLPGYDGSMYREWLVRHNETPPDETGDGEDEVRLSYHGWTQDSSMLLSIRNMFSLWIWAHSDGKHDPPDPWLPPNAPDSGPRVVEEASFESMWAMVRAAKQG